ncbi:hypothetical protein G3O06_04730 [Burkholderia sp. Ac-20345]|uniref:hypothetical protein n=1 Tax=Burkholderia sp. Ac-20345 TaxID=2703891 RepID=UPI00197C61FA|nr:hypothetical protein [Burkholderia sp. Ac-20345]MBN3776875.1 hypothetical protein [Burkholderia sp. Ac-20345]
MIGALLLFLGLAPAGARSNPCDMPGWTMGESVAFVCDMNDAKREAQKRLPLEYHGERSEVSFRAAPVGGKPGLVLIVTDRIVPVEDAPREAELLWVDEQGKVHGANDAWNMPIAAAGSSSKPAGTVVYLVNAPVPVSKMSSVAGEPPQPVQDAFARAELTAVEPASTPCTRRCTGTSLR